MLQKIIVVYGPTASGKTKLGIELAKKLDTQIISTDSRQIYRHLDIGTGKATPEEMQGVVHHMIDIINPDEKYSVGEYKKQSEEIINNLFKTGKTPILLGGTGLYIDSIIYNFSIPRLPADWGLREKLEAERVKYGNGYIWQKLSDIDPGYAIELHPNNYRYIIRAIEVKTLTGKSKKDFKTTKTLKYNTEFITPYDGDRNKLYANIDKRVQDMFDNGLLEEIKNILSMGYSPDSPGLDSIGYKEPLAYLSGQISLDEAISQVQKNSRNYAKRQLTWFKKYGNHL